MPHIDLKYGRESIRFSYDDRAVRILETESHTPPLSDIQLGEKLDEPIGSQKLEDIVEPGETVLFVVPDSTRRTACGQIINLLVRRMIANGTAPNEMSVIFATGIHRRVTTDEKHDILTPFIAQRLKMLDHDPRDLARIMTVGETSRGVAVGLNRALTEFDHVVLIGGVTFHYFAGFTGGRKLICPGLGSVRTITETHKLAFDCERKIRRDGVGTGLLDGNPVHEAFVEAASLARPSFAVNAIVDDSGAAIDLFCGDWIESHRAACDAYAERNTIEIDEKRDLVIVSSNGFPYDINVIQAHKALEAASFACREGGTIVLVAECSEGMGHKDMLGWFESGSGERLAERLCERYQVNGQTAWSFLQKAERFDVALVSALSEETTSKLGCRKIEAAGVETLIGSTAGGYLIPSGAGIRIR